MHVVPPGQVRGQRRRGQGLGELVAWQCAVGGEHQALERFQALRLVGQGGDAVDPCGDGGRGLRGELAGGVIGWGWLVDLRRGGLCGERGCGGSRLLASSAGLAGRRSGRCDRRCGEHGLAVLRRRDAEALRGPGRWHLHADAHELGHRIGPDGDVLCLVKRKQPLRGDRQRGVERHQRAHQVAGERCGDLPQVALQQILPHLVVHRGGRVASLAVDRRGERAAQQGLAGRALGPIDHRLVRVSRARRRLLKLDSHAFRQDAGGRVADADHGLHERIALLLGCADGIAAQPHGQPMNLQKLGPVARRIVAEEVGPGQHAHQARAAEIAAVGGVAVKQPAQRLQRLRAFRGLQAEPALGVHRKPLGVAQGDGLRPPPAVCRAAPLHLRAGIAFEDTVCQIEDDVLHVELTANAGFERGDLLAHAGAYAFRRDQAPVGGEQRAAALAQLCEQVGVALLHVRGERGLRLEPAAVGLGQQTGQARGGEAIGGMVS